MTNLYDEVEQELNLQIPNDLKLILKVTRFDNEALLREITDADLNQIEEFVRQDLPHLIAKEEYVDYFGIFSAKFDSYKLLAGSRKIIYMMKQYFQKKFEKELKNRAKSHSSNKTLPSTSSSSSSLDITASFECSQIDLTKEDRHILTALKKWVQQKCTSDEEREFFENKFNNIIIAATYKGNEVKINN